MTPEQSQMALQDRLRDVLGAEPATTLFSMLQVRNDLVTKGDLEVVRTELKSEIGEVKADIAGLKTDVAGLKTDVADIRSEMKLFRTEMDLKYATKADLMGVKDGFEAMFHSYVRTFIVTQAATVVGISGILFGLTRFT